jgi:hypothetical protein
VGGGLLEEEDEVVAPPVMFETVAFPFKQTTLPMLKDIAKAINVQYTGTKKVIWEQILKSGSELIVPAEDDASFTYRHVKAATGSVPTWIILTPEIVPPIEGIDMATGAQRGFFGPTNKDNAVGATRNNFCTHVDDKIQRPVFGPKKPEPMPTDTPPVTPPIVNEKGCPSKLAYTAIGDVTVSRPKDFFDLQLSPGYISNIRKGTNYHASAEGVGMGVLGNEMKDFGDFVGFDDTEIYKFIGILFANGLMPRPMFETWFYSVRNRPMYGNTFGDRCL